MNVREESNERLPEFIDLPARDYFDSRIQGQLEVIDLLIGGGFSISKAVEQEKLLVSGLIHEKYVKLMSNELNYIPFCLDIGICGIVFGIDSYWECFEYTHEDVISHNHHFANLLRNLISRRQEIVHVGSFRTYLRILDSDGQQVEEYSISTNFLGLLLPKWMDVSGNHKGVKYEPMWPQNKTELKL